MTDVSCDMGETIALRDLLWQKLPTAFLVLEEKNYLVLRDPSSSSRKRLGPASLKQSWHTVLGVILRCCVLPIAKGDTDETCTCTRHAAIPVGEESNTLY